MIDSLPLSAAWSTILQIHVPLPACCGSTGGPSHIQGCGAHKWLREEPQLLRTQRSQLRRFRHVSMAPPRWAVELWGNPAHMRESVSLDLLMMDSSHYGGDHCLENFPWDPQGKYCGVTDLFPQSLYAIRIWDFWLLVSFFSPSVMDQVYSQSTKKSSTGRSS